MTWKSERWQQSMKESEGCEEDGDVAPRPLEITYLGPKGEEHREMVYEDCGEDQVPPRLLVSLDSVTALKELCEHEHARHDNVVAILSECRTAYYKELRWLREQLYLAYQTDEEAMIRKANWNPDDFEVYWYEPPRYVDRDTREFLTCCIRETNRRLIDENSKLRHEAARQTLMDSSAAKTVLRQLRKSHAPGSLLRELRSLLVARSDVRDFEETAAELLAGAAPTGAEGPDGPREAALREELEALKQKQREDEALIGSLRAKLASALSAHEERERLKSEGQRAELVQQHVDTLRRQCESLQRELRDSANERARKLQHSLSKLNGAMSALSPAVSCACTPNTSPLGRHRLIQSGRGATETPGGDVTFDAALSQLDDFASSFDMVAKEVLAELQAVRDASASSPQAARVRTARTEKATMTDAVTILPAGSAAAAAEGGQATEEAAARADGRAEPFAVVRESAFDRENAELHTRLGEAHARIEQLEARLLRCQKRNDGLRARLAELGETAKDGLAESDEEPDKGSDFLVPYTKRAAITRKRRWQLLSEDAACAQRKREYLSGQRQPASSRHEEVTAAFQFLSDPSGRTPTAAAARTARDALNQLSPGLQAGSRPPSKRSAAGSSPDSARPADAPQTQSPADPRRRLSQPPTRELLLAIQGSSQPSPPSAAQPREPERSAVARGALVGDGGGTQVTESVEAPQATAPAPAEAEPRQQEEPPSTAASGSCARALSGSFGAEPRNLLLASASLPALVANAEAPPQASPLPALRHVKAVQPTAQVRAQSSGQSAFPGPLRHSKQPTLEPPMRSPTLARSPVQKSSTHGRALRDVGGALAVRHSMPLTNGSFGRMRQSKSATDVRALPVGPDFAEGSAGVLPEVLPALPPGRMLKGAAQPAWLATCVGVTRSW